MRTTPRTRTLTLIAIGLAMTTAACGPSAAAPSSATAMPPDTQAPAATPDAATPPATPGATPEPTPEATPEPTPEVTPAPAAVLEITGPEGTVFQPRQARMYVGTLTGGDGLVNEYGALAECHWRFYLNERDTEAMVAEMENRSSLGSVPVQEVCPFTSTFIEGRGELRVELTLDVTTFGGEVLSTLVAERMYTVK